MSATYKGRRIKNLLNLGLVFLILVLASCVEGNPATPHANRPSQETTTAAANEDIAPTPSASPVTEVITETTQVKGGIFEGSGLINHRHVKKDDTTPTEEHDTSINFVNTDIHDVIKAVLGDTLKLNYVVSPAVQGKITIKVNQPLTDDQIIPILDTALRLNGAAIVSGDKIIKVVPLAEAPRQAKVVVTNTRNREAPGFGFQIVPLRYISAEEMQKILVDVVPDGGVVPVETLRNVLILSGTEEDRSSMLDIIDSFDVDWLSGMSFGLFPLKEADAESMAAELWQVLGNENGPMGKVVKLVPFERLNAVLVISSQAHYLKDIQTWVKRLDVDHSPSTRRIWVYQVQNGRAKDLSATLAKLLSAQGAKPDIRVKESSLAAPPPSTLLLNDKPASSSPSSSGQVSMKDSLDALTAQSGNNQKTSDDFAPTNERIIADESTNSLVIWATKSEYSLIEGALRKLDITPMQVRIEAVIAEVTLTDDLRYGVQYLFQHKNKGAILTNGTTKAVASTLPGFSAFVMSSDINVILDLLQNVTTVHVISSPQLMVLNNHTAMLQVGDQVPIATQSSVSTLTPDAPVVNSIEMKDTGVILKVTPRVNANGMVLMDVAQEVSDVTTTTTSQINSPTIQERKIASSVAVRDGETIALGGLIKDSTTSGKTGIPGLSQIPIVGGLFGTTTDNNDRTELLALITPRIVRNDRDVRAVTKEMREQMHAVVPLDAKVHDQ